MNRIFLLVFFLASTVCASAQSTNDLLQQAAAAYQKKEYAESASLFRQAIEKGTESAGDYYNAACSYALAGDKESAFRFLEGALKKGWTNASHLQKDADLQSLHSDQRWQGIVNNAKSIETASKKLWDSPALKTPYKADLSYTEKVAGVSKVWSEVKFNFVNFDLIPHLSWDSVYVDALSQATQTKTTAEYYKVLSKMIAQLKDGHTNVYPADELTDTFYAQPPIRTRLIENKVIVIRVDDDRLKAQGIIPGTELITIDGVDVKEYAQNEVQPYQPASTPQDLDVRVYEYGLLRGPVSQPLKAGFRNSKGKTFTLTLDRLPFEDVKKKAPQFEPFKLTWLKGNVAHVELNTFGNSVAADQFIAHFDEISKADAIIFDVRNNGGGNGNVGFRVLSCLTDKPIQTSSWFTRVYKPSYRAWGNAEGKAGSSDNLFPANGKLCYDKPVVVLTSPRTYSAAEDFAVAFDVMKRGKIIGEATGGSTGQPLMFDLPGGGFGRVCTKRDTYPDGKEFVGVGVQPTIQVRPTVADLRKGKDTVLEAALKELAGAKI